MLTEGKPARREDALLDKISELRAKRDATLGQMDVWAAKYAALDPKVVEMLDDIRFRLL